MPRANDGVLLPRWMRSKSVQILIPVGGGVLLGGAGWLAGPLWVVPGVLVGTVAAYSLVIIIARRTPVRLLAAGRPLEAHWRLGIGLSMSRKLAARLPMFRDVLADNLDMISQAQLELGNEPRALEAVAEAAAIWADLAARRPGRYTAALADARLRQAALLARMGRHGEALAAVEPAVTAYRRLSVDDRSAYLPCLAAALTRQADELGYLDRIAEARATAAEAEMISSDMLPSTRSRMGSRPPGSPAADGPGG